MAGDVRKGSGCGQVSSMRGNQFCDDGMCRNAVRESERQESRHYGGAIRNDRMCDYTPEIETTQSDVFKCCPIFTGNIMKMTTTSHFQSCKLNL